MISIPIDPQIQSGYMSAILRSFDRGGRENRSLPEGVSSWQKLSPHQTGYTDPGEMRELQQEFLSGKGSISHDLVEPVKPVGSNFAAASGLLKKTVCADGRYGRVEGMRMGSQTMQLYYVVHFTSGAIQYYRNFEIEKLVVKGFDLPQSAIKRAADRPASTGPMKKKPARG